MIHGSSDSFIDDMWARCGERTCSWLRVVLNCPLPQACLKWWRLQPVFLRGNRPPSKDAVEITHATAPTYENGRRHRLWRNSYRRRVAALLSFISRYPFRYIIRHSQERQIANKRCGPRRQVGSSTTVLCVTGAEIVYITVLRQALIDLSKAAHIAFFTGW